MTSILTNVTAMAASRQLGLSADGMQSTIERLTTGKRINSSADNAAGLANADQFNAESIIAAQDVQTANNGYFAAQASDGYLQEATNQVQTLVQLYAGGNGSTAEASSVLADANAAMTKAGQSTLSVTSLATATTALATIDTARGTFAATMVSSQSTANLDGIEQENATAQQGNVMDANIGDEVVNLTKWQVLSQTGTSALSSANQSSQYVLALFR
jgi:flagellin